MNFQRYLFFFFENRKDIYSCSHDSEKISGGNRYPVETWKLGYEPLDAECVGAICNQYVPNILQQNARTLACIFAENSFLTLSSKLKGLNSMLQVRQIGAARL
jgi:hypothetical protein